MKLPVWMKAMTMFVFYEVLLYLVHLVLFFLLDSWYDDEVCEVCWLLGAQIAYIILFLIFAFIFGTRSLFDKSEIIGFKQILLFFLLSILISICHDVFFSAPRATEDHIMALKDLGPKSLNAKELVAFLEYVILTPVLVEFVFRYLIFDLFVKSEKYVLGVLVSIVLAILSSVDLTPLVFLDSDFTFSISAGSIFRLCFLSVSACVVYIRYGFIGAVLIHSFFNLFWFVASHMFLEGYWECLSYVSHGFFYWLLSSLCFFLILFLLFFLLYSDRK